MTTTLLLAVPSGDTALAQARPGSEITLVNDTSTDPRHSRRLMPVAIAPGSHTATHHVTHAHILKKDGLPVLRSTKVGRSVASAAYCHLFNPSGIQINCPREPYFLC